MNEITMKPIARIHTDFPDKFGIPRQSGLVGELRGTVVFEPEFRNPDALRGLEGFSHIWLIWQFSEAVREDWSPTVRPPRLGGNTRMGVFATRSPFRPNAIGLSSVKLEEIRETENGAVLVVSGADLMDGTPILDVKPYLPFTDSHPDAVGGFAEPVRAYALEVVFAAPLPETMNDEQRQALRGVLAHDPRPSYQNDPTRIYGLSFAGYEVKFLVDGDTLTVVSIE